MRANNSVSQCPSRPQNGLTFWLQPLRFNQKPSGDSVYMISIRKCFYSSHARRCCKTNAPSGIEVIAVRTVTAILSNQNHKDSATVTSIVNAITGFYGNGLPWQYHSNNPSRCASAVNPAITRPQLQFWGYHYHVFAQNSIATVAGNIISATSITLIWLP